MEYKTKANKAKKATIEQIKKLIADNHIVGILNVENLPAKQLQKMRETLRKDVFILGSKKRLIKLALSESKKEGLEQLSEKMIGMPALLFTNDNPFKLFKTLKKNQSNAPIKGGNTAPNDIIIKAQATPFAPGPIIGELGAYRIKTGVENGKVAIKEDSTVAKAGDKVDAKLAGLLTRLGIEPMKVGLDLVAVCENGNILTKEVLDIDEDKFIGQLLQASNQAINLSINSGYPTKETISLMLAKAYRNARNLAMSQDIVTDDTFKDLLIKAQSQATLIQGIVDPDSVKKTVVQEEDPKQVEPKPDDKSGDGEAPMAAGLGALFG